MRRRAAIPMSLLVGGLTACGSDPKDAPDDRPPLDPAAATPEHIARGRELYLYQGCLTCHSTDGSRLVGPTLRNLYASEQWLTNGEKVTVDAAYIRRSLLAPDAEIAEGYRPGQMLNYSGRLSADDIDALIAYIASLNPDAFSAAPTPPTPTSDLSPREDGRPSWWFDGVRHERGRLAACGEALGADLASARAGAAADARSALRERIGVQGSGPLPGEAADLQTVWPLPNAGGDLRYAGYVLLSTPDGTDPGP